VGGIAAGKSFWAKQFQLAGAAVISADAVVADLYTRPEVLRSLVDWGGPGILTPDGKLDRRVVADLIFRDAGKRQQLEALIHPLVSQERDRLMHGLISHPSPPPPPAVVIWDIPLLMETGMHHLCHRLFFVDTPPEVREARARARGWDAGELARRQSLQLPLATKVAAATRLLPGDLDPASAARLAGEIMAELEATAKP
jgi:dephospho-CoA kinase